MQLPTAPVKATRSSPKWLILYSLPKVGKTDQLTQLPGCLIGDAEGGAEGYDCLRVAITCSADIDDLVAAITAEGKKRYAEGLRGDDLFPYRFIALDTIDEIEEMAVKSATTKYKKGRLNTKGKFEEAGYTSVNELPDGHGYQYSRAELLEKIEAVSAVCPHLILIVHVKDKYLADKDGTSVATKDLSLTGKMASILPSRADAIGYMYRSSAKENRGQLMISFETFESSVMGARQKYLAGQKFPFNWARIYPDEPAVVAAFPKEEMHVGTGVEIKQN